MAEAPLQPSALQGAVADAAGLRGLQLPEPVGWWPLAPGWWLLLALALLFALALIVGLPLMRRWRARHQRRDWLPVAHGELHRLQAEAAGADPAARAAQVVAYSRLLRRVALAVRSREEVAALTGQRWLALLDELAGEPLFRGSVAGRLLLESPYRPPGAGVDEADLAALQGATRRLLKRLAANRQADRPPAEQAGEQAGRASGGGRQHSVAGAGDA